MQLSNLLLTDQGCLFVLQIINKFVMFGWESTWHNYFHFLLHPHQLPGPKLWTESRKVAFAKYQISCLAIFILSFGPSHKLKTFLLKLCPFRVQFKWRACWKVTWLAIVGPCSERVTHPDRRKSHANSRLKGQKCPNKVFPSKLAKFEWRKEPRNCSVKSNWVS